MSELHYALIGLAVALLLALYVYNKWQERRALKRLTESLNNGVGDPLLDPATPAPVQVAAARFGAARIEPTLALPDDGSVPTPTPGSATAPVVEWVEDPLLDAVLELRCAHAVDGVTVIDAAGRLAQLGLPLPALLVAWDARSQQWVKPDRFGYYTELLVATQLAHRRLALDEVQAARFVAAAQQVALELEADCDPPPVKQIVEQAQQLDALCAKFDVKLGLSLEAGDPPWDGARLTAAIAQAGLTGAGAGAWVKRDAQGRALFSLTSESLLADRLLLELDVPLVPQAAQPLRQMAAAAAMLAAALRARIVDDAGRPIDAGAIEAIDAQLATLYEAMRGAGLDAGSARALRLYGASTAAS
jgi:hypothetical protein